jgi:transcriptional regulator with XRE-family HTH domain
VLVPTRRTALPEWVFTHRRELGENIVRYRKDAGLSQEQLADKIGMERRSIQRYERAERDPAYSHIVLIAHALGVQVVDLVRRGPAGG